MEKHKDFDKKTPQQDTSTCTKLKSTSSNGLAITPPDYGIETIDSQVTQAMPAPENKTGLPDHLKMGVESLSGYSLDNVRVHFNSSKPSKLNALAYTQGTEIHVAPGQERHLPHEMWHVVQQKQGRVKPTFQLKGEKINDEKGLEKEADMMRGKTDRGKSDLNTPRLIRILQQNDRTVQRETVDPNATTVMQSAVTSDQVNVTNNGTGVTADAIQVLKEIVAAIGETSATITSGRRTPSEQATAMYNNLESTSIEEQKNLYGPSGDKVIDVYKAGKVATPAKDTTTIQKEMTDKINELGPSKVSLHCSNNSVIDVAPSSIKNDSQFQSEAEAHTRVTKYLGPATTPKDPAHHLEIK